MKIKTSELSGVQLDWAVKKAIKKDGGYFLPSKDYKNISHSTNWAQSGPIIEREGISLDKMYDTPEWCASMENTKGYRGPTPLVAAMRCYVASKLDEEVEVPDALA